MSSSRARSTAVSMPCAQRIAPPRNPLRLTKLALAKLGRRYGPPGRRIVVRIAAENRDPEGAFLELRSASGHRFLDDVLEQTRVAPAVGEQRIGQQAVQLAKDGVTVDIAILCVLVNRSRGPLQTGFRHTATISQRASDLNAEHFSAGGAKP